VNYDAASVQATCEQMEKAGIRPQVMIDCSHANSNKNHTRQSAVCLDVAGQISRGDRRIIGVMLESNLVAGAQKMLPGKDLVYGQSITDACIGWDETRIALQELATAVRSARSHEHNNR
jgi:3-deoxy-7-phosphoheptulonate synthase